MAEDFGDMFNDMFGGTFGKTTKETTTKTTTTTQVYFHPRAKDNIAKIYTFARTISEITLKPTKQGTYVIVDCNNTILEEAEGILKAKIRYINIVLGK